VIVLDATLVAKWFLPDEMSPKADSVLDIVERELGARLFLGPTSRLAQQYDLTAYDAEYLALALDHQAALYTGDEALWHAAQAAGLVAHVVE
jgi:predicted nucleic acid-binding protein